MKKNIEILYDVYNIADRLKEIDETYFILYNLDRNKYEVHSNGQKGSSYCFTVPFDTLDSRTIEYARQSSITRKDEIIKEIDLENQKREFDLQKEAKERLREVLE